MQEVVFDKTKLVFTITETARYKKGEILGRMQDVLAIINEQVIDRSVQYSLRQLEENIYQLIGKGPNITLLDKQYIGEDVQQYWLLEEDVSHKEPRTIKHPEKDRLLQYGFTPDDLNIMQNTSFIYTAIEALAKHIDTFREMNFSTEQLLAITSGDGGTKNLNFIYANRQFLEPLGYTNDLLTEKLTPVRERSTNRHEIEERVSQYKNQVSSYRAPSTSAKRLLYPTNPMTTTTTTTTSTLYQPGMYGDSHKRLRTETQNPQLSVNQGQTSIPREVDIFFQNLLKTIVAQFPKSDNLKETISYFIAALGPQKSIIHNSGFTSGECVDILMINDWDPESLMIAISQYENFKSYAFTKPEMLSFLLRQKMDNEYFAQLLGIMHGLRENGFSNIHIISLILHCELEAVSYLLNNIQNYQILGLTNDELVDRAKSGLNSLLLKTNNIEDNQTAARTPQLNTVTTEEEEVQAEGQSEVEKDLQDWYKLFSSFTQNPNQNNEPDLFPVEYEETKKPQTP